MNLTMNITIIELSFHACNFALKVLDKEEPGARVWPKLMSKLQPKIAIFELFWKNSSYVSGVNVCIFVALYVRIFIAGANKVEGTKSWCLETNEILAST